MQSLKGKRVLICGGATGIGAATAELLARNGARILVGDINEPGAKALAERLTAAGGTVSSAWFDLSKEDSVRALLKRMVEEFGGLDCLYNVGADLFPETIGRDGDLLEMDPAIWRRTFDVNLLGYALTCREAIPLLLKQGKGAIVNTSSNAAFYGEPTRPAYACSKAAINALTRHIASRWGKQGIRCNGVSPGMVLSETALAQMSDEFKAMGLANARSTRLGKPTDVSNVVGFLLSDESEWINGQTWTVDGGWSFHD